MESKILLIGRPCVGKTTLVQKILGCGIPIAGGFVTEEIREQDHRVGFRVKDIYSSNEAVLAHVNYKDGPRVGKYGVDVTLFDCVGVNALREAMGRKGCMVIDEIGKMELCSEAFREAVTAVMDSDYPVLGTIPIYRHPFLNGLRERKDVTVIEVTASNREKLPLRLVEMLGLSNQASS